jgi:hypothetical protein
MSHKKIPQITDIEEFCSQDYVTLRRLRVANDRRTRRQRYESLIYSYNRTDEQCRRYLTDNPIVE